MNVLLVQGTWGDDDQWWKVQPGTFAEAVVNAGHTLVGAAPDRAFEWSEDLGGVGFGKRDLNTWRAAGRYLLEYIDARDLDPADLTILAHSHGRQVVLYACEYGLQVGNVVLVSGPIRQDVAKDTPQARARIGRLTCMHGGLHDRWQWLGALFDGHLGIRREDSQATTSLTFAGADHGSLLRDPAQYGLVLPYLT